MFNYKGRKGRRNILSLFIDICEYAKIKIITTIILNYPESQTSNFPEERTLQFACTNSTLKKLFGTEAVLTKCIQILVHILERTERMDMSLQALL